MRQIDVLMGGPGWIPLQSRFELVKIGHLLGVDPSELGYLFALPAEELCRLRDQLSAAVFEEGRERVERLAAATRMLPIGVSVRVARKSLGPFLAGRVAELLEPERMAEIVTRLPAEFVAEACAHLDPRQVSDLMGALDDDLLFAVAQGMVARRDYLTMGRFVGWLPDTALERIIAAQNDETVLQSICFMDQVERTETVLRVLGEHRLVSLIRTAGELGLWPQAMYWSLHVPDERRARIAYLMLHQDSRTLDSLVRYCGPEGLWPTLLGLLPLVDPADRRDIALVPALRDRSVLQTLVRAVAEAGVWVEAVPLLMDLPRFSWRAVAAALGTLPDRGLAEFVDSTVASGAWWQLEPLLALMDPAGRARLHALPAFRPGG